MSQGPKKLPVVPMRFETWWREVRCRALMPLVATLALVEICRLWPQTFSDSLTAPEPGSEFTVAHRVFPEKNRKKVSLKHQREPLPIAPGLPPIASLQATNSAFEVTR